MVALWPFAVVGTLMIMTLGVGAYVAAPLSFGVPPGLAGSDAAEPVSPQVDIPEPEVDEDPAYTVREASPAAAAWQRSSGSVPTAQGALESRSDIVIRTNKDFNPAHGIRAGKGTWEDPYVITGWSLGTIQISDTDAYILVKENYVRNRMVLNWNGDRVNAHHNYISDLRVNENVKRTGDATSGIIADNVVGRVGQLRHFDGEFAYNQVGGPKGPMPTMPPPPFFQRVAVNFDGFNGARFHHNDIIGVVDVRLHGHHHGSYFETESHNHVSHDPGLNHSVRYHSVYVEDNTIVAHGPYALRYFDRSHSANDRTANSETEKRLNDPHVHYLKVRFARNQVTGGGIFADIMNAEDKVHTLAPSHAWVTIADNHVTLRAPNDLPFNFNLPTAGIHAQIGRGVELVVQGNDIVNEMRNPPLASNSTAGIRIQDFKDSTLSISGNRVQDVPYGVWARMLSSNVDWYVWDNEWASVKTPVWYDSSVDNPPKDHPGP